VAREGVPKGARIAIVARWLSARRCVLFKQQSA
jgi:hypothetical protein